MRKIYMIGNTHFDPVWLWHWEEAMASIRNTFRSALDRIGESDDFVYSFATPPVFEWIKNTDPQLFEDIKSAVARGRWELCEAWWLQPDTYSASGESYVREGLYGQRYLRDTFGKISDTVFNIDSFGHSPALPQILKKSHIDYYCFVRPEIYHVTLPSPLFRWKGIDGSEVAATRVEYAYSKDLPADIEKQSEQNDDIMMVYGVTDHGGAPTKKMIQSIRDREDTEFSTVTRFFKEHEPVRNLFDGELLTRDFGPYANLPDFKRDCRKVENMLIQAEKASVLDEKNDGDALTECWKDLLFQHFHDILGGTSIKTAYIDARASLGRAYSTAKEILQFRLQDISRRIQTPGVNFRDPWNLVVFNLSAKPYSGYAEAEVQWVHEFDFYSKGIALEDAEGHRYSCQMILEKSVIPGFRSRFLFRADIPAMGYKTYRVIQTGEDLPKITVTPFTFGCGRLKITFNEKTGCLSEVCDTVTGKRLSGNIMKPAVYIDDGDTWCFQVTGYGEKQEDFTLRDIRVTESGCFRTVVRAIYAFRDTLLTLRYSFHPEESYFDVAYSVNFNGKHLVLKLDTDLTEETHISGVPYGMITRESNTADVPASDFLVADGVRYAFDGVSAYSVTDKKLGLTLLRTAIYGDLRLETFDDTLDYDIMSQGITEGRIRCDFGQGNPVLLADSFMQQPIIIDEGNHDGELPPTHSYVSLEGDSVMLGAYKDAIDGKGRIVRLISYSDKPATACLKVGDSAYNIDFKPFEIRTLRLDNGSATEVFMTED